MRAAAAAARRQSRQPQALCLLPRPLAQVQASHPARRAWWAGLRAGIVLGAAAAGAGVGAALWLVA